MRELTHRMEFDMSYVDVLNSLRENISQRNTEFENASRSQRRVIVAKDTLDAIESRLIIPGSGVYLAMYILPETFTQEGIFKSEMEDVYPLHSEKEELCKSCAIGSLFISKLVYRNHAAVKSDRFEIDNLDMREALNDCFADKHLRLIECAFEMSTVFAHNESSEIVICASSMYSGRNSSSETLTDICENIIANNGWFVVTGLEHLKFCYEPDDQITNPLDSREAVAV